MKRIIERVIKEAFEKGYLKSRFNINSVEEAVEFIEDQLLELKNSNKLSKSKNKLFKIYPVLNNVFDSNFDDDAIVNLMKLMKDFMQNADELGNQRFVLYPGYAYLKDILEKEASNNEG